MALCKFQSATPEKKSFSSMRVQIEENAFLMLTYRSNLTRCAYACLRHMSISLVRDITYLRRSRKEMETISLLFSALPPYRSCLPTADNGIFFQLTNKWCYHAKKKMLHGRKADWFTIFRVKLLLHHRAPPGIIAVDAANEVAINCSKKVHRTAYDLRAAPAAFEID